MKLLLERRQCTALRGLGIILIILHNYCHWLEGMAAENEYTWTKVRNSIFWDNLFYGDFKTIAFQIFSYWGHYGVPIFLFLSGYGLASKYNTKIPTFSSFIKEHYLKLIKLMILGYLIYLSISYYYDIFGKPLYTILFQITLVANLFPHPDVIIDPGPYWYLGITMQLYIIYALFGNKLSTRNICLITFFSLIILFLTRHNFTILKWIKYNFIGSLLPFTFGIIIAKSKIIYNDYRTTILASIAFMSLLLIILLDRYFISWLFAPVFFIVFFVIFINLLNQKLCNIFYFIGCFSAHIFIIPPIIRVILFKELDNNILTSYTLLTAYFLTVIIVSILYCKTIKLFQ